MTWVIAFILFCAAIWLMVHFASARLEHLFNDLDRHFNGMPDHKNGGRHER